MCRLLLLYLFCFAWSSRIKEILHFQRIHFLTTSNESQNNSKIESTNAMPVALERWENKLFLVTPRLKLDIPATLSYINITSKIYKYLKKNG